MTLSSNKTELKNEKRSYNIMGFLLGFHSWLVYIFLYLPIIVLIAFSFSKSRSNSLSETLFSLDSSKYQAEFDKMAISDKLKEIFSEKQFPLTKYANLSTQKADKKWQITDKAIFITNYNYQMRWALNHNTITADLRQKFETNKYNLSDDLSVTINKPSSEWIIKDKKHTYRVIYNENTEDSPDSHIKIKNQDKQFTIITDKDINYIAKKTDDIIQISLWYGFSLDWYKKLFTDKEIFGPTKNSFIAAILSTLISTILGTMIAFAMNRFSFLGKSVFDMVLLMPIIIPDIVMGISLLTFYVLIHFTLGIVSITIAHITFNISFVAVVVRARLHGYDKALDEAAMDLGANPFQTFMKVTLPIIAPGVIGGALIAFTLSLDDYLITSLVAGTGSTTLPVKVYSMMKFGVTPEINALSTLILLFTMILILMSQRLGASGAKYGENR